MDTLNQPSSNQPTNQPTTEQPPTINPKSSLHPKALLITLALFILLFASLTVLILGSRTKRPPQPRPSVISPSPSQPSPTPVDPTANWKTYRNEEIGFEVRYPDEIYTIGALDSKDTYPESNYERHVPDFREGIRLASSRPEFHCSNFEFLTYQKSGRTLSQWMQEYPEFERGFEKKESSVFAGKPSMSFSYARGDLVPGLSLVEDDSFIIQINIWGGLSGISPSLECGSILSTLKFIDQKDQVVCTQDAKMCPDGSYVSRQPPNCEFAKCP